MLAILAPLLLGGDDAGVLLEIDLARFQLSARDLATSLPGPTLPIAVGSPSHPTPKGDFLPIRIVRHPAWTPGPHARSLGARPVPPSPDGPLGLGKLPLESGAIQIHAGAHPLELGKPNSLGCVRLADEGWRSLITWLESSSALHPWRRSADGDAETGFRRPLRVVVR